MNKFIIRTLTTMGCIAFLYVAAWAGYDAGTKEFAKKALKYAEENPDKTMKDFLEDCEKE